MQNPHTQTRTRVTVIAQSKGFVFVRRRLRLFTFWAVALQGRWIAGEGPDHINARRLHGDGITIRGRSGGRDVAPGA